MDICTWWWFRRCLQHQARTSFRQTIRCPIFSFPLPSGPDVAVSVDYSGPLPVTPLGNCYIVIFSSRIGSVGAQTCTPSRLGNEGAADILVNEYIRLFGCVRSASSRIMDCTCPPSCHMPCTNFWECEKSPRAPVSPTTTAGSNVSITSWLRY